jgi:DNA-binding MarR family transcriptional regulator
MTETMAEPSLAAISAWTRLIRAQQQTMNAVEGELKQAGLPPLSWYDALLELSRAEGGRLRPSDLQERLLLAQSNVSRLIDRLETAGFAERCPCPGDARGQLVAITGDGERLRRQMWPVYRAAIQRHVADRLGAEERATALAELLGMLIEAKGGDRP